MMNKDFNKFAIVGFATTFSAATLISSLGGSDFLVPEYNYNFHKHMQLEKILYNYEQTNTDLVIEEYSEETLNEFGIITDFVSKLINNSKQLDKEFAEALNKGFWEII